MSKVLDSKQSIAQRAIIEILMINNIKVSFFKRSFSLKRKASEKIYIFVYGIISGWNDITIPKGTNILESEDFKKIFKNNGYDLDLLMQYIVVIDREEAKAYPVSDIDKAIVQDIF